MPITIKSTPNEGNAGSKVLPPKGNKTARLYKLIHFGTIEVKDFTTGDMKWKNMIRLEFELPKNKHVFKEGSEPQPFSIGRDYTLSLYHKSALYPIVCSLMGKNLTEEETNNFDLASLLGKPCKVEISHTEDGKYANLTKVSMWDKDEDGECPTQINPSYEFGYEPFDQSKFDKLPEWIQKKIQGSKEYKAMEKVHMDKHVEQSEQADDSDSLPF